MWYGFISGFSLALVFCVVVLARWAAMRDNSDERRD
jgi:hypothetical protein